MFKVKENTSSPAPRFQSRAGLSLLEMLAVVTLMGIFSAAVASRFGRDILGDVGVRGEARRISLGILEAKRTAIRSGVTCGVQFSGSTSNVTGWSVIRELPSGAREVIDGPFTVEEDFVVATDSSELLFDFEGHAQTALKATLTGPHREWQIVVFPLTGMIDCSEVTP